MPNTLKLLLIPTLIGVTMTLSGCITNPGNSSSNNFNNREIKAKLVYDLTKQNIRYAENQLRERGYSETGRDGNKAWWYNDQYNQCYQIEEADGVVKKVHFKSASDCNKSHGNYSHSQHKQQRNIHPPQTAIGSCIKRFGEFNYDSIENISELKPDYWEIIVKGKRGRRAACTVDGYGSIGEWSELK